MLVLTPARQAARIDQPNSFLPYIHKKPKLSWEGVYTVSKEGFKGQVVEGYKVIVTSLDRPTTERLGLKAGQHTQVEVGKSLQFNTLLVAEMEARDYVRRYGWPEKPGGCVAYWWRTPDTGTAVLVIGDEEN